MSKFINTDQKVVIDSLVEGFKDRMKNPYYTFTDKKPTIVTYYNINKAKSTLDESLKIEWSRLGKDSPLRFNKINNFFLYGIERISTELELGDWGIEGSSIEGEAIVLPNTIEPLPNDYFVINYTNDRLLFRVNAVTMDTIENDTNFWKISYKLDRMTDEDIHDQIVDEFEMILTNVGTQFKSIIRKNDYDFIDKLEAMIDSMKEYYIGLFYNDRVQTLTFNYNCKNFYDPYMIEFIIRNKLLTRDNDHFLYVCHQTNLPRTFMLDYDKTVFKFIESPDLEKDYPRYISQGFYIDEVLSIFSNRPEEYFQIQYMDKKSVMHYAEYIINNINQDMMFKIFNNERFDEGDYRNIIIGYFYKEEVNSDTLELLEKIEFDTSMDVFYNIPILIYVLEKNIKDLLKTYK